MTRWRRLRCGYCGYITRARRGYRRAANSLRRHQRRKHPDRPCGRLERVPLGRTYTGPLA